MDGRQTGHYVPGSSMQEYGYHRNRHSPGESLPPPVPGGYGALAVVSSTGKYGWSYNQASAAEAGQVALREAGPSKKRTRGGWRTGRHLSSPDAVVLCWKHEGILVLARAPDGKIGWASYQREDSPSGWPLHDYPGGRVVLIVDTRYGATYNKSLEVQAADEQRAAERRQAARDLRKAAGLSEDREW